MTNEQIYERLNKIFQNVFDEDRLAVRENTTAEDIDGWDSLEHINLIVAIEDDFGMKFSISEVTGMKNVGAMVEIIRERATK
jgi:acyl carrier protein